MGLCIDLIYSALSMSFFESTYRPSTDEGALKIVARYFTNSDNKVGKGFAILGIYLYTSIYCTPPASFSVYALPSYSLHTQILESTVRHGFTV